MKLFNRKFCLLLASLSLFTTLAQAKQHNELIIVNHYDKSLAFIIDVNHEVLPDLPTEFTIGVGEHVVSRVVDINKETYIYTSDDEGKSGFWGVDVENGKTHIHGYKSQGMAYSSKEQTIIFCTTEDYKQHGSCIYYGA